MPIESADNKNASTPFLDCVFSVNLYPRLLRFLIAIIDYSNRAFLLRSQISESTFLLSVPAISDFVCLSSQIQDALAYKIPKQTSDRI